MVASLILGGGAGRGLLSDAILQLLAIPLLLVSLWRIFEVPLTRQMRLALWFCLAIAILPLLQLIPLPPWLWTALPNRQPSAEAFDILGRAVPWMPISVSPKATWLSALSLLPPLAVFLSTLLLSYRERRWLMLVVLAVGVLSVFDGLIQVAQGETVRFVSSRSPIDRGCGILCEQESFRCADLLPDGVCARMDRVRVAAVRVRTTKSRKPKNMNLIPPRS